jgi:DNA-binding NtrC family response regulator
MPRVLVVDADVQLGEMLQEVLSLEAHVSEVVQDLDEALSRLRSGHYDVVFGDILGRPNTPALWDGLELLKEAAGETPIVLFTGFVDAQTAAPANIGVSAVLSKPADITDILGAVGSAIEG